MHTQQFLGLLDENNLGYPMLERYLLDDELDVEISVFSKKEGVQVVPLPSNRWAPVFDVRLEVCFCVPAGFHGAFETALFGYHTQMDLCAISALRMIYYSSQYLECNYGWHITTIKSPLTERYCAEMSKTYVLDAYDKAYLKLLKDYHIRRGLR